MFTTSFPNLGNGQIWMMQWMLQVNFARVFTFLKVKDFEKIVSKFANEGHAWQSSNLCGDFILDSNVNKCP